VGNKSEATDLHLSTVKIGNKYKKLQAIKNGCTMTSRYKGECCEH
jgi:hypothetical protein